MLKCVTCEIELATEEQPRGVCEECADMLGVVQMPPARRPPLPCLRCNGSHFVRAVPRELTVEPQKDWNHGRHAPMFATYEVKVRRRLLSPGKVPSELDARRGLGMLEIYICRGCGFVEWYCHDPSEIALGPQYMTEEIDVGGGVGPYR